jgi:hypothetical protein
MAFKPFVSGMLFDAAWLGGQYMTADTDPITGTRVASYKAFMEGNWDAFCGAGFTDAVNCNPGVDPA